MGIQNDQVKSQLRGAGLRATPARMAVLRLLQECAEPMDVQDMLRGLGRRAPDQATVYRNLSALVTAGLVKEVALKVRVVNYEVADLPHHHHLICEKCGFVEGVTVRCDDLKPVKKSFRTVKSHNLEFVGICQKCA